MLGFYTVQTQKLQRVYNQLYFQILQHFVEIQSGKLINQIKNC